METERWKLMTALVVLGCGAAEHGRAPSRHPPPVAGVREAKSAPALESSGGAAAAGPPSDPLLNEERPASPDERDKAEEWRWIRWRPADRDAPRRGGGYDRNTTYELVNSEHSHLPDYDKLFPQRLSYEACGRIRQTGYIFPWIYSLIEGSFTAPHERQKMYRTAYVACPASSGARFIQEIVVAQDSKIVARFNVPDRMYIGYQYDVDQDGVTEAIVEWHSRLTPAHEEGRIGIVRAKGGVYRELYRGRWAVMGDCPRKGARYHEVALGVRRTSSSVLQILEEEWQVSCDPKNVTTEVGDWEMTQSQTTTIELGLTPTEPTAMASRPFAARPE